MKTALWIGVVAVALGSVAMGQDTDSEKPLSAVEAREKLGQRVFVAVEIKTAKDRLEKRGEIYLDSELNFRDEKNLAIVITRKGADSLRSKQIDKPAERFQGKKIKVRGVVSEVDGVRRIEVDDADQIEEEKAG
jgi:DNA/RNA endonuclease YhcR with UshA esterase domain